MSTPSGTLHTGPYDDPYALIAAIYDAEMPSDAVDLHHFQRHGLRGPLLVLGCGTGRISGPLSRQRPVVGLDISPPMIAFAQQRYPAPAHQGRYVVADMCDFDLGTFEEVIAPNAAFSFLLTRAAQAACLRRCHAALPEGGKLILDLPMPDYTLLGTPHTPEKPAWEGVVNGQRVARTREVTRAPVAGRLELVDRYWVDGALLTTSTLRLALHTAASVEWMLESCGFYVDQLFGSHADTPLTEGCDRLLVHAYRM